MKKEQYSTHGLAVGKGSFKDMLTSALSGPESIVLRSMRYSVMLAMPLLFAAAMASLVRFFPLPVYQNAMVSLFGPDWKDVCMLIGNSTVGIFSLVVAVSLSFSIFTLHNQQHTEAYVEPTVGTLVSIVSFFIMVEPTWTPEGMIVPWAGVNGLFCAFLVTLASTKCYLYLHGNKRLKIRYYSDDADPLLPYIFDSLLPALCTMLVFLAVRLSFFELGQWLESSFGLTGYGSLHQAVYNILRAPFADAHNSFGMGLVYVFVVEVCWFFGIHGTDLLSPITHDIFARGIEVGRFLAGPGEEPALIISKELFDVFVFMGGAGTTVGLVAAILLRARDSGARRIALMSLLPGLFNINELVLFGLPIVFNPVYAIPFILGPVALLAITCLCMLLGIVPAALNQVDWTTPPLISGYMATGSWTGPALQLFNITLATLFYMPFVKFAEQAKFNSRRHALKDLADIAKTKTRDRSGRRCVDAPGAPGALARALANDLTAALARNDGTELSLLFQPRVNLSHRMVVGVSAVMQWDHPQYGPMDKELTRAIAEDVGVIQELDTLLLRMSLTQQRKWRELKVRTDIFLPLSESQLEREEFPLELSALLKENGLEPDCIHFAVSEDLALSAGDKHFAELEAIRALGFPLLVEEFGKGYLALVQLKKFPGVELQIDRTLVNDVASDAAGQDVVGTIQEQCIGMGIKTSVEAVTSREQLETLLELNFSVFQGDYFSPPLPPAACAAFIATFGRNEKG